MKKILLTGKNGQLSIAVSEYLNGKSLSSERISLRGSEWQSIDLTDYSTIVHIAGVVPKNGVKPEDFYNVNYRLTEEFAKKAKESGVKHFIYLSSMSVYGIEPQISVKKGTITKKTPCLPKSDYGKSKLLAEESLKKLQDENFKLTIIRTPSIYGKGKTEYLDQYRHLVEKFNRIPKAFVNRYKSIICIDNLCELIYLIIKNEITGIICPDDGKISAFDICKAINPKKGISKLFGVIFSILQFSDRIRDYYGAICYSSDLTDIFNGRYRVCDFDIAIERSYER